MISYRASLHKIPVCSIIQYFRLDCYCLIQISAISLSISNPLLAVTGDLVAVKIMESVHEVVEEVEEEYLVLRDLGGHGNLPAFHGIYLKLDPQGEDQIWIAMEVGVLCNFVYVCIEDHGCLY